MPQLSEAVKDAMEYLDSYSVVLAGDLNVDLSRSYSSAALLEREGFHSAIALPAAYPTTPRGFLHHRRTITGCILQDQSRRLHPASVMTASDHHPIWFELKAHAD